MPEPLIKASHIDFAYGDHQVLRNVTFAINQGDYVGLIGPNGSGKTTLLKIMLGLLKPNKGTLTLYDQTPANNQDNHHSIGYVPQRIAQTETIFPASVEEVIASGRASQRGLSQQWSQEDQGAVEEAMRLTGVTKHRQRLIYQLSGGERQRVFIARALAAQPELLILDEPTVGVDIESQESFYSLLCTLNKKHKLTIILVSHDIDVIAQEVKTLIFLNQTVIAYGPPQKTLKHEYIQKLYSEKVHFISHKH